MGEHTPAPWQWVPSVEYGYSVLWNPVTRTEVLNTSGLNDGDCPVTWMGEEMSDADARLIAAAPCLLEAAELALEHSEHEHVRAKLRAAISRARQIGLSVGSAEHG